MCSEPSDDAAALTIESCFCCFADILGFSAMVDACRSIDESHELLTKVWKLMRETRQSLGEGVDPKWSTSWDYALFSDCLVLGRPIRDHQLLGEPDLGLCIDFIAEHQLRLALSGFFLRGAITIGELHIDTEIVFGKALVGAARLEKDDAKMPRVILSEDVASLVQEYLQWYSNPAGSPWGGCLLADEEDDRLFVDWLPCVNYTGDGPDWSLLEQHRDVIAKRLEEFADEEHIRRKYEWLRDYHNYYCRNGAVWSVDDGYEPPGGTIDSLLVPVTAGTPAHRFRPIAGGNRHQISLKARYKLSNMPPPE